MGWGALKDLGVFFQTFHLFKQVDGPLVPFDPRVSLQPQYKVWKWDNTQGQDLHDSSIQTAAAATDCVWSPVLAY